MGVSIRYVIAEHPQETDCAVSESGTEHEARSSSNFANCDPEKTDPPAG
jgi:hypothetical protein